MKINTGVITRMHYPKGHPQFDWRFNYYKKQVLPRLQKQTDKDFEIWVWCEEHHRHLFERLGVNTFLATYEPRQSRFFLDFTPYSNTVGLPKFNVQCGLDSDELVEPNYIETIHKYCTGNKTRCIMFQGVLLDIKTGKRYHMARKYDKEFNSAMFALYQPNLDNYHFILQTSGHRTCKFAQETIALPEGFVTVSIHGANASTLINRHCTPIYPWTAVWDNRAKLALQHVPQGASVIDLGGGMGTVFDLRPDLKYTSVDYEKWTPQTVKADLNKEYPLLPQADYVLCLGVLEYMKNPQEFVQHLGVYGKKLILSYRPYSKGGMPRYNCLSYEQVIGLLRGWKIKQQIAVGPRERIFVCEH